MSTLIQLTVTGLAFNRTGTVLASGSAGGSVWLWDMDVTSWMRHACRIANRNLTVQEWQTASSAQQTISVSPSRT